MKIIKNTSAFDSKKLRSLFSLIHNQVAKYEGRLKHWNSLKIIVRQKSNSYSGRAYIGQVFYDSSVPKDQRWDVFLSVSKDLSLYKLAQLFAHELYHSYGFGSHKSFRNDPLDEKQFEVINKKFDIKDLLKVVKPKVKIDYVALRFEKAKKGLAKWESKQKRINNLVKKYRKQVAYYERKVN
tara:strand:- start:40 stop:585 length:546 start_codon:yes stop_codon:yes gene_type:complete